MKDKRKILQIILLIIIILLSGGFLINKFVSFPKESNNLTVEKRTNNQSFNSIRLGNKDSDEYKKGMTYSQVVKKMKTKPNSYYDSTEVDGSHIKIALWKNTNLTKPGKTNNDVNGFRILFHRGHAYAKSITGLKLNIQPSISNNEIKKIKNGDSFTKVAETIGDPDVYSVEKDSFSAGNKPTTLLYYFNRVKHREIMLIQLINGKVVGQ